MRSIEDDNDMQNEFLVDNRPGTSHNWGILAKGRRQMPDPSKSYLIDENERTFRNREPLIERLPFPPGLLFGRQL
jgi:hypothetical protein